MTLALRSRIGWWQTAFLALGVIALGAAVAGALIDRRQFFFSYLFGCLFWLGLSLGCLLVTMIHQLTGGRWGYPTRRFLEAGFMVLPLMLLLFIPIFLGLHNLYPWAGPSQIAAEPVLRGRHSYQNMGGFIIRAFIFFVAVIGLALALRKYSLRQDATADAEPTRKARTLSGPGVVVYVLLATFVYVDWIMSLEQRWYSTMFPVIIVIGQILSAYAFVILMLALFRMEPPFAAAVTSTHYHHLGTLLFTFVLFWTYVSFGQLLVIYSGDLPDEIDWYLHRIAGSWKAVVAAIALFHFFVPFFLLLFRTIKRRVAALSLLAALVLVMRMVDLYWLVMPSLHHRGVVVSWMDFAAVTGIGGFWSSWFLAGLKRAPLLPQQDPGIQFAFSYGQRA
jgi:hypothetical protein